MCQSRIYYPMFIRSDGKHKILFKYGFDLGSRDGLEIYQHACKELPKAHLGLSSIASYNALFKEYDDIVKFDKFVQVPCGSCSECLSMNSKSWSYRILKEASLYDNNYFVTLTYNDDCLPSDCMLDTEAISKFNKKLKVYLKRKGLNSDFRFYGVGEYGSHTARPHYHVIYFNLDIPDLKFENTNENGDLIFSSKFLEDVWSYGYVYIGSVDVGSANYVARYCDKKKRLSKEEKQKLLDKGIVPEFARMSNRPGIGGYFLDDLTDRFIDGKYNEFIKGKLYSYPLYYTKKIKELLVGTVELENYERLANLRASAGVSRDMILADQIGDNIGFHVNDFYKTNRK